MYLNIDIGNTKIKTAVFDKQYLLHYKEHIGYNDLMDYINEQNPERIILSSVKKEESESQNLIRAIQEKHTLLIFNHQTPIPVENLYETPATLGMDRLAAVIGAKTLYPEQACMVIDAGTCITYDFVNQKNQYLGGSISLGLQMRFQALNYFTSKLPLVVPDEEEVVDLIGKNTKDAILSGVINGMIAEIEGIIGKYQKEFGAFAIIFCGGDANFFEKKIKFQIFAVPKLIHFGLNRILEYNVAIQNSN